MSSDLPVMLITGTSRGIGRQLASHYAKNGYRVIGCSRGPVEEQMQNYHHVCADVTNEIQLKELLGIIRKEYGRLDVLINNAGIASGTYAILASADHIRSVYETNVIAPILLAREAVKLMKRKTFGRIINISSIHVPLSTIGTSIYGSAKRSIEQFARVLSREVGPYGITVNTIGLSYVQDSGMAEEANSEVISKISAQLALTIHISLSDVTHCLDFYLSAQAGSITGQTIYTSGA